MFYRFEEFLDRLLGRDTLMHFIIRASIIVAMVLLTIVSMWTTYVSVKDSILPEPVVTLPLMGSFSFLALFMAFGIGLMLLALKMAILDEQKHLNAIGVIGLVIIAFISIAFNMDVLYRTADQQFFLNYCNNKVRSVYEPYFAEVQTALLKQRDELRKAVASQATEVKSEIDGLRERPAGYGRVAREEIHRLRLLKASSNVEAESIEEALRTKREADVILAGADVRSLADVQSLQNKLRATIKDAGALAGIPMPLPVEVESPLFAVFAQLFDWRTVGLKEIFFLAIAIFLDLGDIIGYKLVPNKRRPRRKTAQSAANEKRKNLQERLALPAAPGDPVLMDAHTMNERFQNYCKSCGFRWNPHKKLFKRNDGTVIRQADHSSFSWELAKGERVIPIWIANCPISHQNGVEIPAQVWNMAKTGNAILLEPQNGEFVEMQCEAIRQDVEAGRLKSTAVYRVKVAHPPPTTSS